MIKYSFELKKKAVKAYTHGEVEYKYFTNKYGIPKKIIIKNWIVIYKAIDDEELMHSR